MMDLRWRAGTSQSKNVIKAELHHVRRVRHGNIREQEHQRQQYHPVKLNGRKNKSVCQDTKHSKVDRHQFKLKQQKWRRQQQKKQKRLSDERQLRLQRLQRRQNRRKKRIDEGENASSVGLVPKLKRTHRNKRKGGELSTQSSNFPHRGGGSGCGSCEDVPVGVNVGDPVDVEFGEPSIPVHAWQTTHGFQEGFQSLLQNAQDEHHHQQYLEGLDVQQLESTLARRRAKLALMRQTQAQAQAHMQAQMHRQSAPGPLEAVPLLSSGSVSGLVVGRAWEALPNNSITTTTQLDEQAQKAEVGSS
jgi:hypothetical protein